MMEGASDGGVMSTGSNRNPGNTLPATEQQQSGQASLQRLPILRLLKDAQQRHGLRQGNYLRYRGYCGRRARRIRRSLKFTHQHKGPPNRPAKFTQRAVTIDAVASDARFLELVLFDAERDWAYALQLRFETVGDEQHPRKRFHMRQKLRRAVKWARSLETLTRQCEMVDIITKLEAQAYSAFMRATLCVELARWRKAAEHFKTVIKIYEKLSASVRDQELMELYQSRCREAQNPLRLCEHNCQREAGDAPAVASLQMIGGGAEEELDLDFNKLALELDKAVKEVGARAGGESSATEQATRQLLEQLKKDWRAVDVAKLKAIKPNAAVLKSLPLLQPMPCKPMFFDLAIHHLKNPVSAEQLEGKKKEKTPKQSSAKAKSAKTANEDKAKGKKNLTTAKNMNSPSSSPRPEHTKSQQQQKRTPAPTNNITQTKKK